jgi:hypothetical protein
MNTRLCFATLAFNKPYRDMAKVLAADLAKFAPDHGLVVVTDDVEDFKSFANVFPYRGSRTGFFHCYSDRRFLVSYALGHHAEEVVHIDADTRIHQNLPAQVNSEAKLVTTYTPNLEEQCHNWLLPKSARAVISAARSFGVDPAATKFTLENLYSVKQDKGREKIFIQVWEMVTKLFDFQGVDIPDGYCMSIAAAVAGWVPSDTGLELFNEAIHHEGVFKHGVRKKPPRAIRALKRGIMLSRWMVYRQKVLKSLRIPASV